MDSTTMKGTVQGYFDRAFDEMSDKDFETPLANSALGVKAKLAPNPKERRTPNAQRSTLNSEVNHLNVESDQDSKTLRRLRLVPHFVGYA